MTKFKAHSPVKQRHRPNILRPGEVEFIFQSQHSLEGCVVTLEQHISRIQQDTRIYKSYSRQMLDVTRRRIMSGAPDSDLQKQQKRKNNLQSTFTQITVNSYAFEVWEDDNIWKIVGEIHSQEVSGSLIQGHSKIQNQIDKQTLAWWVVVGLYAVFFAFLLTESTGNMVVVNASLAVVALFILIVVPIVSRVRQIHHIINQFEAAAQSSPDTA